MNDTKITLRVTEMYGPYFTMEIDLLQVAIHAGKRVQDDKGRWIVDYPIPRARKLINTILKYGTEEDFRKCEAEFKTNAWLYQIWDNLSQSQWKTDEPVIDLAF